uniref:Uncharacterized protein n=1 Tax=Rhizophora mucronata TaxID=61149 RepID=A0A2P2IIK2_RHIMU
MEQERAHLLSHFYCLNMTCSGKMRSFSHFSQKNKSKHKE